MILREAYTWNMKRTDCACNTLRRKIAVNMGPLVGMLRRLYYKIKAKKLANKDVTIIASDCFGTFMYHNLGLRFNSPTINLAIPQYDFLLFVSNLKGYLQSEVTEVSGHEKNYPVGKIVFEGKPVTIHFMHYKSFEEAIDKWNERKKRVNLSNLCVVQLVPHTSEDYQKQFDRIPFDHKMLITDIARINSKCIVPSKIFTKPNYYPGKVLEYPRSISVRRYMDKIDYVSFMNKAKIQ